MSIEGGDASSRYGKLTAITFPDTVALPTRRAGFSAHILPYWRSQHIFTIFLRYTVAREPWFEPAQTGNTAHNYHQQEE